MQVNANVSESDIGGVREGQLATFGVDAYPGRVFEGKVVQVRNAPIAVQNVVTYDVVVGVENADYALKPGMTATVTITTARRDDVLRVPLRALRFRPENVATDGGAGGAPEPRTGESAVYLLDGREPRKVEIETGLRSERWAEVLDGGVAAGDAVVVSAKRNEAEPAAPAGSPLVPQPRRRR
jgi:HlyD family secretion protein